MVKYDAFGLLYPSDSLQDELDATWGAEAQFLHRGSEHSVVLGSPWAWTNETETTDYMEVF